MIDPNQWPITAPEHPVNMDGYDSLFAGDKKWPANTSPKPKTELAPTDQEYRDALSSAHTEAVQLREEAVAHGEALALDDSSSEIVLTMLRANDTFGEEVAEIAHLDPKASVRARQQLTDILEAKIAPSDDEDVDLVAPETFVVSALALNKMAHLAPDQIERKQAVLALDSLGKHPEELTHLPDASGINRFAGELAIKALHDSELISLAS